jgi:uncharacterized protein YjdB
VRDSFRGYVQCFERGHRACISVLVKYMRLSVRAFGRVAALLALSVVAACGGGGGDTPPTEPPPTTATVELSSTTVALAPNGTSQLTATARASSGAVLSGRTFTWNSASPAIATVSPSGLVTGVTDGTTTITVSADGKSAVANVTVRTAVASVTLTPATGELTVGGTPGQLTAAARDANNIVLTGRTFTWSTSSSAVATVSQTGLVTAVAAGTATITATSEGRSGTATITVRADQCSVIRPFTLGQTFNGTLTNADCKLDDQYAIHFHTFAVTQETALEIEMMSTAVDSYLGVFDADLNLIAEDDDGGATGLNSRILRSFKPGAYLVVTTTATANSYGAYQLSVKTAPAACSGGRATTLPTNLNTTLAAATACRLNDDSYLDRYELTVSTRNTVRFDMTSNVIDPYLVILDNNGAIVAQDDDAGAGLNAHIEIQLEAGKYHVMANAQPRQTGAYRLEVAVAVDPCAVSRTINISQPVNGTITTSDCAVSSSGPTPYTQRYLLNVTTAGPYQIDMQSNAVDAYLILQNASSGAILAENDDATLGNTNARIAGNFSVGQYIVNATTYANNETGNYTLSVTPITTQTPVSISVNPVAASIAPGQTAQLTAIVTGSPNTTVTWQSSATGVATVSDVGLVRAISPGTATITVRSAADPSKTATASITVSQSQGVAPNLDIAAMYVIQSVQQLDGSVKLVANRDAVARIYVRGSRTGMAQAAVRLRAYQGATLLQTFEANVTPALSVDESCCSANISIPGSLIRTGVSLLADVDPNNALTEANETDNTFPLSGTPLALNVVTVPDFNLRLVPIRQNRNGQTGVATASILSTLRSVWPLGTVNATTRTGLAMDYTLTSQSFDEWSFMVRDLELVRRSESSNMYYYGLVRVTYTSGVLGLAGGIPALSAIGLDEGSSFGAAEARLTLAHEMGHTMGLRHAPCGGAAGPDPAFPFNDGRTGAFGMDIASGNVIKMANGTDIMGYCDNQWISVYNYRNIIDIRTRNPNGTPASIATTSAQMPVLMVTGSVNPISAQIDGSFAVTATANNSDPSGRFILEGYSETGRLLFTHRFTPFAVSDGRPNDEAFVVGVPLSETVRAQVARLSVREVSGTRSASRSKNVTLSEANASASQIMTVARSAGSVRLQWQKSATPIVLVRNPSTNEIVGVGRTGDMDLSQFDAIGNVELLISDGVSSIKRSANTKTGVIRQ